MPQINTILLLIFSCIFCTSITSIYAIPKYDEGALIIKGVQLLQDRDDKNAYYYLPQYPRLAQKADKSFEFLCIKYNGKTKENNGGLFHALIEFSLPEDILMTLDKELKKINKEARIIGPVPLMENQQKEGEEVEPSFRIISAVLSSVEGKNAMTSKVISSGRAPITPGSKAAIAAQLNESGATLLWSSLQSNTSDVSVSLDAYYEAAVKAYNAVVTAKMKVFYSHFSQLSNKQAGFKKEQVRKVIDSIARVGGIDVKVFDRSASLNVKTGDMESILNVVVNKLTEAMFNLEKGWATGPNKVDYKEGFREVGKLNDGEDKVVKQIGDIMTKGPFAGLFNGSDILNQMYVPDDQYILKDIKDIKQNEFTLNLSKEATIKVPIHTAGNIGSIYGLIGNDSKYFKIIDMNDPAFQRKEVMFMINGDHVQGFGELVNNVCINFRKKYNNGQDDVTGRLSFIYEELKKGILIKTIEFPRLGIIGDEWEQFEYQIQWNLVGDKSISIPAKESEWKSSRTSIINLEFPFEKTKILLDADKSTLDENSIKALQIRFASTLAGNKSKVKDVIIRSSETEISRTINIYHDANQAIVYQVVWFDGKSEKQDQLKQVNKSIIYLIPQ